MTPVREPGSLKWQVSSQAVTPNGRHTAPWDGLDTAPALAVRARPCAPLPPSPARTDA